MFRKTLAYLILFSMVLHCASRLGILSYLYKNRNEIASAIGLISEVPIALCSSAYDFDESINIQHHNSEKGVPVSFTTAHEITLFFQPVIALVENQLPRNNEVADCYLLTHYVRPHLDIYQPPRIS